MRNQYFVCVDRCNLGCDFCWYETGAASYVPSALRLDDLERWFGDSARVASLQTLALTGGEPTLRADLLDLMDLARLHFNEVVLMTNGTRLSEQLAQALAERDVEVHISLDAVDSDYHQRRRGAHAATLRACERLARTGLPRRVLVATLSRSNIDQVAPLRQFAADWGFSLKFQPIAVPGDHPDSLAGLEADARRRLFGALRPWAEAEGKDPFVGLIALLARDGRVPALSGCSFAAHSIVIESDGEVYPCFVKRGRSLGNVRTDRAAQIADARRAFLEAEQPGSCLQVDCLGVFA